MQRYSIRFHSHQLPSLALPQQLNPTLLAGAQDFLIREPANSRLSAPNQTFKSMSENKPPSNHYDWHLQAL
jgi:hypothetical protein